MADRAITIITPADAAFSLLSLHREGSFSVSRRAGQFLGQLVASNEPMSDKQAEWLAGLMDKAGLPEFKGAE